MFTAEEAVLLNRLLRFLGWCVMAVVLVLAAWCSVR
jgi:hypothetical protein